jgi:hypothetical protein
MFFREIITVYGGNYMTHTIVLHFITVLQQLVHIVTIMLPLVDNDGMTMIMMMMVVVVMIMMISTRH